MKNRQYLILSLFLLTLIFPAIGLIGTLIVYFTYRLSYQEKKILIFNVAFSYAMLSFSFVRINNSGDIVSYALSYYSLGEKLKDYGEVILSPYDRLYYLWYKLMIIFNHMNLDFRYFNALVIFIIVYAILRIILQIDHHNKRLLAIFLLFNSMPMLFTQYHNLLSYVIFFYGLYFIYYSQQRVIGYIFLFLSTLVHPAAYIPLLIYIISIFIKKINRKLIVFSFIISFVIYFGINNIPFETIIPNPVLAHKVKFYFTGDWTRYRLNDFGEWIYIYKMMILFIISLVGILFINKYQVNYDFFEKYNKFIFVYLLFAIIVLPYRSVAMRVISSGFIFFIPLLYQIIIAKRKSIGIVILLFLLFDPRTFLSIGYYNDVFKIGSGFPKNIFMSTYQILSAKEYKYEFRN